MKFKISKSQWEEMGKKAGWLNKSAQTTSLKIPGKFISKLADFPESSMGAVTIKLDLFNGQKVNDVIVDQEGTILWVNGKRATRPEDLKFNPNDIINVSSDDYMCENCGSKVHHANECPYSLGANPQQNYF